MFNVGGGEMVLLAVLALLVFGPESLPGLIKNVVRTVKAIRTAANDFQHEVRSALEVENERLDLAKRQRKPLAAPEKKVELLPLSEDEAEGSKPPAAETDVATPNGTVAVVEESEAATEAVVLEPEPVSAGGSDAEPETRATDEPATDAETLLEDDDDGPGIPMAPKRVGGTA